MKKFKTVSVLISIISIVGSIFFFASYYFSDREVIERERISISKLKQKGEERSCELGRKMVKSQQISDAKEYLTFCGDLTDEESFIIYQNIHEAFQENF